MKLNKKILASAVALLLTVSLAAPTALAAGDAEKDVPRPERTEADTSYKGWITMPEDDVVAKTVLPDGGKELAVGDSTDVKMDVSKAGQYAIALTYRMKEKTVCWCSNLDHFSRTAKDWGSNL